MTDVTRILFAIEQGEPQASEQLLPLVYDELRKLAASKMAQEAPGLTLQATGLVHEAYLRLVDVETAQHWNSRGHFFGACAEAMRRILVQLWMVEEMFRTAKSLLETRPIYHQCDETIRGHVFCSFLALTLRKELQDRLAAQGDKFEWAEILRDLEALQYVQVEHQGKRFLLRSEVQGTCAAVFRAAGVAIPPTVQKLTE